MGSPFGTGIPATAAEAPNKAVFSRFLDGDGKYALNPDTGRYADMPQVRQRVLIALRHLKDSSPVLPEGIVYPRKLSLSFDVEMDRAVRAVLRSLTDVEKLAVIDAVIVEREGTGRAHVIVSYTDLTIDDQDQVTFEF